MATTKKNQLHSMLFLAREDFDAILDQAKIRIQHDDRRTELKVQLALAFAHYESRREAQKTRVTPSTIKKSLLQIQRQAESLADMLHKVGEATDLMARATDPRYRQQRDGVTAIPVPVFADLAVQIMRGADAALRGPLDARYIATQRGDHARHFLMNRLLDIWRKVLRRKPTFAGNESEGQAASAFVAFAAACYRHVGLRATMAAVRNEAVRIDDTRPRSGKQNSPTR